MGQDTEFCGSLLEWYHQEARVLPWRSNPAPYRVWISEMMLQQTRVETVIPYFSRFVREIPTIEALSTVDEEQLLKLWQGLGYYSRALNLKKAAIDIMDRYHGELPSDINELQSLPGIGPYSAAAISSIAFQQQTTLMDGNVLRVTARILGIKEDIRSKEVQQTMRHYLEENISRQRPGDFNQALMELGATRCLPNGAPLCDRCPVSGFCQARILGLIDVIPMKIQKTPREIQEHTVLVIKCDQRYGIQKRGSKGLLAKMWVFPMIPYKVSIEEITGILTKDGYYIRHITPLHEAKHIFTHIEWHMAGYEVEVTSIPDNTTMVWETAETIRAQYAMPKAMSYFAKHLVK